MKKQIRNTINWCGTVAFCALILVGVSTSRAVEETTTPASANPETNAPAAELEAEAKVAASAEAATNALPVSIESTADRGAHRGRASNRDMVVFGRSTELEAGRTVNDVVVIGGSATVLGRARDAVVAILGNVNLEGETKDAVAVLGNVRLGTNATARGDVVAVLGNVKLGPNAKVHGDVVAVGGKVERAEGAVIDGDIVGFPGFGWLGEWLEQCVFKLRPLAPQLGWLWVLVGILFLLYLLVALALPRPVQACTEEITRRPATTLLVGLLVKMLIPLVTLILVVTGVGIFVVPFLSAAVMFAGIIGKIAVLQYLGQQIGRRFGIASLQRPILAFVCGWIILTLLYLAPVLGMVVYGVTGLWALGAATLAMFGGTRRELPPNPNMPPPPATPGGLPPAAAAFAAGAPAPDAAVFGAATSAGTDGIAVPPVALPPNPSVTVSEALTNPRASFWERMGAGFLDVILVGILSGLVGGAPLGFLVALAYFAGMWAWKGTTIGGVVLKLKVVRLDGLPVTFAVALVRALAAAFSVVVLFLGFLWIAFDRDKQGWHDKIAGTVVIRQPQSVPLVCL